MESTGMLRIVFGKANSSAVYEDSESLTIYDNLPFGETETDDKVVLVANGEGNQSMITFD